MLFSILRSGYSVSEMIYYLLIFFVAISISFAVHEFAHAIVAYKLGDSTPYNMGRVTLNPLAHIDPVGALLLILCGFGWGKPVVFNPSNITKTKKRRLGVIMVSAAGVTANFIVAFISALIVVALSVLVYNIGTQSTIIATMLLLFSSIRDISLGLLAFNLIPIPPLDGFHIVDELLPFKLHFSDGYKAFVQYGPKVLFALIILGNFLNIPILSVLMGWIEFPFAWIINKVSSTLFKLFI